MSLYDMGILVLEEAAWTYITSHDNTIYPGVSLLSKMSPPTLYTTIPILVRHLYGNNPPRLLYYDSFSAFDVCPSPLPSFSIAPLLPTLSTTPPLVNTSHGNVQGLSASSLRSLLTLETASLDDSQDGDTTTNQESDDLDGVD